MKKENQRRNVRRFPPSEDLHYPNSAAICRSKRAALGSTSNQPHVPPLYRQGSVPTIQPVVSEDAQKELSQLAASVHYLKTKFLKEVRKARFNRDAPVYVIENLKGPQGVIRRKGKDVTCPVDGKPGAAYVHCLKGEDSVGKATHMLSYSWR